MQTNAPIRLPATARAHPPLLSGRIAAASFMLLITSACTTVAPPSAKNQASIPVLSGWFEGEEVFYITTDVSHADVAQAKGANFAPRLAHALPVGKPAPGQPSSVDKVYAVTNFQQANIFASAPFPMGFASRDTAYSPLWQMVKVS